MHQNSFLSDVMLEVSSSLVEDSSSGLAASSSCGVRLGDKSLPSVALVSESCLEIAGWPSLFEDCSSWVSEQKLCKWIPFLMFSSMFCQDV